MIDSLAITAITNFLLACELFFLVGLFAAVEKERFIVVIANYAPVIVLLLAFSVWGLRNGRGSRAMVIGLTIMIAASLVQVLRVGVFYPLDHNGLYHLIALVGVIFLYRGGLQLKTAVS